ncbi:MAG: hypothetical protein WBL75_17415 [Candidatus Acidiferrum sp.]
MRQPLAAAFLLAGNILDARISTVSPVDTAKTAEPSPTPVVACRNVLLRHKMVELHAKMG